jgi:lactate permease
MPILLAAAPILISMVMILALRLSALRAGAAGLAAAVLVVLLAPGYRLALDELGRALLSGALTTLMVSYVLFGGLLVYSVLRQAGALTALAEAVAEAVPDPARRALILVLGLSVFFESATGFGIGIVVAAPLFVALGYRPRDAALLALAGQCAVTWGALAIGTTLGAELTGVPAARLGVLSALLSLPLILLCGGAALWLTGGAAALRRSWAEMLFYGVLLSLALAAGSHWVGIEVAGMIGGLTVAGTGFAIGRLRGGAAPRLDRTRLRAAAPFGILLLFLLVTRLVPPLREGLGGIAVLHVPEIGFSLPLLYHPGFWLVLTALVSLPLLRIGRADLAAVAGGTLRPWLVATFAVAGFLCFSQIMVASGMTLALAEAVAAATGRGYVLLLPLVGGLGGFLTASNAGSNAMFAGFQEAMSGRLDLPEDVVIAAQNAAGANTTLASPGRVVLAAAVTGLAGQEGTLMRPALGLAAGGLVGTAAMLWIWIG